METRIITISREFGSGGRTIAKEVANKLGFKYYDKELVKQISVETGFHEDYINEVGQYAPSSNWFSMLFSSHNAHATTQGLSMNDFLWTMQYQIISKVADEGPCVIVGRCADFVLRERDDCFNVFIHSNLKAREERILRLYGSSDVTPEKRLTEKDKKRKLYYKHYTGNDWGMSQNYDLCLDSSRIGIENCADIIIAAAGFAK